MNDQLFEELKAKMMVKLQLARKGAKASAQEEEIRRSPYIARPMFDLSDIDEEELEEFPFEI